MKLRTRSKLIALTSVSALSALSLVAMSGTASAAGISSYSTSLTPPRVIAGSTAPFTFTFTDTSTGIGTLFSLGSVAITSPAGFTASGPFTATASNGAAWSASQSGNRICLTGGTALNSGQSVTFGLTVTAGSASGQWATTGYPSTNCSGLLNSFPYSADNQPTTQVDTLAWGQQPPDASKIGVALNPAPTVQALNGPAVDTSFTGPITVGLNPASGGLTGTTTVNATNGVATFADLAVSNAGLHYTLTASSNGSPGVTSSPFDVGTSGSSTPCPATQGCTSPLNVSRTGQVETIAQVVADPAAPGDVLNVTVGGLQAVGCTGTQKTATMSFTVPTRTATVKLAYDLDNDNDSLHGKPGVTVNIFDAAVTPANLHPICYSSDQAFLDVNGNLVTTGFLAACSANGNVRPCVQAEWAEVEGYSKGKPVIDNNEYEADVLAPAGDPILGGH